MKPESDLTKLARWIVPGWVGVLSLCGFIIVDIAASPANTGTLYASLEDFAETVSELDPGLTGLLLAASGVPVGFLIYQAYFFLRWNSPFSRDGLLPPLITGRMNDLDRVLMDIDLEDFTSEGTWRHRWVTHPFFQRDHGFRWRYIELLYTEAAQRIDSAFDQISTYARHRYLHEIVHTLGASVAAVYLGFLVYLISRSSSDLSALPGEALALFLLLFTFLCLLGREATSRDLVSHRDDPCGGDPRDPVPAIAVRLSLRNREVAVSFAHPGSILVFASVLIHFFANPVLNPKLSQVDLLLRLGLAVVVILMWILSKRQSSPGVKGGDWFLLSLSLLVALAIRLVPSQLTDWIDWPFFSATVVFLILNLLLLKNRENARLDMLALEYYTLRRFLTEEQHESLS